LKQPIKEIFSFSELEVRKIENEIIPLQFNQKLQFLEKRSYLSDNTSESKTSKKDKKIKTFRTINYPMLIHWHKMKHIHEEPMYVSAFSQVFGNLLKDEYLMDHILIKILFERFFLNNLEITRFKVFKNLGLTEDQILRIWSNTLRGIGTMSGLRKWYELYLAKENSQKYSRKIVAMAQYFDISIKTVSDIFEIIYKWINAGKSLVSSFMGMPLEEVNSLELIKYFFVNSNFFNIFFNQDSIKDNKLFFFEIGLNVFYEKFYKDFGEQYSNIIWTKEQMDLWLDLDSKNLTPNKTWNVLPHYSNYTDLHQSCVYFWRENVTPEEAKTLSFWDIAIELRKKGENQKDYSDLEIILERFHLNNVHEAEVLCAYLEYQVKEKLLLSKGGTYEMLSIAQFFTESLNKTIHDLKKLVLKVFKIGFANWVNKNHQEVTCETIFESAQSIHHNTVQLICNFYKQKEKSKDLFFADLYKNCQNKVSVSFIILSEEENLDLCSNTVSEESSYSNLVSAYHKVLKGFYKSPNVDPTSMALLQLAHSTLTSSPNSYIDHEVYPLGNTVSTWDPINFKTPFEILFFKEKFRLDDTFIKDLGIDDLYKIFNENSVLNYYVLFTSLVNSFQDDFSFFEDLLHLQEKDFHSFWEFIVLYVREYYLGGFYINISENEIQNGIDLHFLKIQKEKPFLLGGNPTIKNPMPIKMQNLNMLIRKYTGEKKYNLVDSTVAVNNFERVLTAQNIFNGNYTDINFINPWKELTLIKGCNVICSEEFKMEDNFLHKNTQNSDKFSILESVFRDKQPKIKNTFDQEVSSKEKKKFISTYNNRFNRTIIFNYVSSRTTESEIEINKYTLDQQQLVANFPNFHQKTLNGFLNITSVINAPILISQNHMFNTDEKIQNMFSYFDEENQKIVPNEDRDSGFYETEKHTSLVVNSKMNHHYNLQIKPSLLFIGKENELVGLSVNAGEFFLAPLFNVEYSRHIDESVYESVFQNVIKRQNFLKTYYPIVLPFFIFFLIFFIIILYKFYKQRSNDTDEEYSLNLSSDRLIGHENMYMDV
jgi:hypothetical protein